MTRRRVLHLIDSLDLGGAQEVVLNLATRGSGRHEHEVAALHGRGVYRRRLRDAGVRVHSLSPHKYLPLYATSLPWRLMAGRYDILHCHLTPSNILGKPLGALLGVPVRINHDHTNDALRVRSAVVRGLDRWSNHFASHIVAVAGSCRDFLIEREGVAPARITLVPNAIDTAHYAPGAVPRDEARRRLGIGESARVVAGVGRLRPQKNFPLFLEVAAALAKVFPDGVFVIAGEGPDEAMLRGMARELGLGERVVFTGYVPDSRVVYAAADVLLMPSRFEGLPMTLLEAMSSGLPVVASRLDGIAEVVGDGVDGFLVDGGSAEGFVQCASRLLGDSAHAAAVGAAAREAVLARYSVGRMTGEIEEIYERFLP
jgi:glycosyltransferase involved in cell wall biosynthesis